jgi:ribosomal protein S18 acetylase RimI-like enzyme
VLTTKLRPADAADAAFIVALWNEATGGTLTLLFDLALLADYVRRRESRQGFRNCRIAMQGGAPIAMLMAYPVGAKGAGPQPLPETEVYLDAFKALPPPAGAWHVPGLAVLEGHRRQGIGSLLLADLEERCRTAEGALLSLHSFAANAAALAFYERHGFQVAGRRAYPAQPSIRYPGDLLLLLRRLRG